MKITRRQLRKLIRESLDEFSGKIRSLIDNGTIAQAIDLAQTTGTEYVDYPWEEFSKHNDLRNVSYQDLITLIEQLEGNPEKYTGLDELVVIKNRFKQLFHEDNEKALESKHAYLAKKLRIYLQNIGYGPDIFESVMWHGKGYTIPIPGHIKKEVLDAYGKYTTSSVFSQPLANRLIQIVSFLEKYIDLETEKMSGISEPDGTVTSPSRSWPRGAAGPQSRNYKYEDAIDAAKELDMLKRPK
jgi:hypothetical protein